MATEHWKLETRDSYEQQHERATLAVADVVDLRGQATAGAADGVVSRLEEQIPCDSTDPPVPRVG